MKKLLMILLIIFVLTSCSNNKLTINEIYNDTTMKTIYGQTISLNNKNVFLDKDLGFGINYPKNIDIVDNPNYIVDVDTPYLYAVYYLPLEMIELLNNTNEITDTDLNDLIELILASEFPLFALLRFENNNLKSNTLFSTLNSIFDRNELITTLNDDKYYYFYNESIPSNVFSNDDIKKINNILSNIENIKNGLIIFPASE